LYTSVSQSFYHRRPKHTTTSYSSKYNIPPVGKHWYIPRYGSIRVLRTVIDLSPSSRGMDCTCRRQIHVTWYRVCSARLYLQQRKLWFIIISVNRNCVQIQMSIIIGTYNITSNLMNFLLSQHLSYSTRLHPFKVITFLQLPTLAEELPISNSLRPFNSLILTSLTLCGSKLISRFHPVALDPRSHFLFYFQLQTTNPTQHNLVSLVNDISIGTFDSNFITVLGHYFYGVFTFIK